MSGVKLIRGPFGIPGWQLHCHLGSSADKILRRAGRLAAPVYIEHLAVELGLELYDYRPRDTSESGYIAYDGNNPPRIYVNAEMPHDEQRFTIAHEVAHSILHLQPGQPATLDRDKGFPGYSPAFMGEPPRQSAIKRQASEYAAKLLVPSALLGEHHFNYQGDIGLLAGRFDVSERVMRRRLSEFLACEVYGLTDLSSREDAL